MVRRSVVLAILTTLAASGCGGDKREYVIDPIEKVTYATGFGAAGRDAFVWVAKEKGFFGDAGIEVDIQKGAGDVPDLTALESDQVQFATMDFAAAEVLAGKGTFTEWRAVAALHQETLLSIMTTADTGITKPADLTGKTIATAKGSMSEQLFPAYAKSAGLDVETVQIQGTRNAALNGLMAQRKVDAVGTVLLGKKALETASKKQVVVLPYSDYLKNLYGNVIVTRADLITEDRDLVSRFTTAALRGLKYTLDHPDEAAVILNNLEPTAAVPAATDEIKAMTPYVPPPAGQSIGFLDQKRVAASIADLQGTGLMPTGLTPAAVADFSFVSGP